MSFELGLTPDFFSPFKGSISPEYLLDFLSTVYMFHHGSFPPFPQFVIITTATTPHPHPCPQAEGNYSDPIPKKNFFENLSTSRNWQGPFSNLSAFSSEEGLMVDYCSSEDPLSKSQNAHFPNLNNKL